MRLETASPVITDDLAIVGPGANRLIIATDIFPTGLFSEIQIGAADGVGAGPTVSILTPRIFLSKSSSFSPVAIAVSEKEPKAR